MRLLGVGADLPQRRARSSPARPAPAVVSPVAGACRFDPTEPGLVRGHLLPCVHGGASTWWRRHIQPASRGGCPTRWTPSSRLAARGGVRGIATRSASGDDVATPISEQLQFSQYRVHGSAGAACVTLFPMDGRGRCLANPLVMGLGAPPKYAVACTIWFAGFVATAGVDTVDRSQRSSNAASAVAGRRPAGTTRRPPRSRYGRNVRARVLRTAGRPSKVSTITTRHGVARPSTGSRHIHM